LRSSLYSILQLPGTFSVSVPNIILNILFLATLNVCCSLGEVKFDNYREQQIEIIILIRTIFYVEIRITQILGSIAAGIPRI
jgi:hypothetical protein